jgi:hypothetical protein
MTRRYFAEIAANITDRHAPPHLRERAYLRAVVAMREGRDPEQAVHEFVMENDSERFGAA